MNFDRNVIMDKPYIELIKVSKVFPPDVMALDEVSLSVGKGEMLFLTGMSGAGKSTLLKMLCCMDFPAKGLIEVAGYDLTKIPSSEIPFLRRRMGVVFQDFKLLPKQTVYDNISMAMEIYYTPRSTIRRRVTELLKILLLEKKTDTLVSKLSRGEQQRVAIARAMANTPALLLADEPTGNLDPELTDLVIQLFKKMNAKGTTIILASHDENIFRHTHRRVVELSHGVLSVINPGGPPPAPLQTEFPQ